MCHLLYPESYANFIGNLTQESDSAMEGTAGGFWHQIGSRLSIVRKHAFLSEFWTGKIHGSVDCLPEVNQVRDFCRKNRLSLSSNLQRGNHPFQGPKVLSRRTYPDSMVNWESECTHGQSTGSGSAESFVQLCGCRTLRSDHRRRTSNMDQFNAVKLCRFKSRGWLVWGL